MRSRPQFTHANICSHDTEVEWRRRVWPPFTGHSLCHSFFFFYLKLHSLRQSHHNPFTVCFSCCFPSNIFHLSLRLVWPVILFSGLFLKLCLFILSILFLLHLLLHCLLSPWLWPSLSLITISPPSRSLLSLVSVCMCVWVKFAVCGRRSFWWHLKRLVCYELLLWNDATPAAIPQPSSCPRRPGHTHTHIQICTHTHRYILHHCRHTGWNSKETRLFLIIWTLGYLQPENIMIFSSYLPLSHPNAHILHTHALYT